MDNFNKKTLDQECRELIYAAVLLLVFEGFLRKILPPLNLFIFFLKDIFCLYGMFLTIKVKSRQVLKISLLRQQILIAFIPIIIYTAFIDPILSVFGAKQYLLYMIIGVIFPLAFPAHRKSEFRQFFAFSAFLVVPTTLLAMIQNVLPASHWLNLSVDGGSLDAFSAAGFLRVSSTFSFTGQYSYFLNAVCVFLAIRTLLTPDRGFLGNFPLLKRIWPLVLGAMLLIGAFVTGGRTAVLGCGAIIVIAGSMVIYQSPKFLFTGILLVLVLGSVYIGAKAVKPEFFAAYDRRASGSNDQTQAEEISDRVLGGLFGWTGWFNEQDFSAILFGNGLGVMANGAQKISRYAEEKRMTFWTETDMPTTAWEGGLYLLSVWYLFRIYVILFCLKIWSRLRNTSYKSASAFLFAFILINGLIGTLSLQPPLAIWWWMMVGSMIVLKGFDESETNEQLKDLKF